MKYYNRYAYLEITDNNYYKGYIFKNNNDRFKYNTIYKIIINLLKFINKAYNINTSIVYLYLYIKI